METNAIQAAPRADFEKIKEETFSEKGAFVDYNAGDDMQLVVKENNKKPGESIFVLDNGKCGFSTINSIPSKIGDTIKGKIKLDLDTVFFIEVNEIIQHAPVTDEKDE